MGAVKSARARRAGLWLTLAAVAALLVALAPPAPQAAAEVQSVPRPAVASRPAALTSPAGPAVGLGQVLRVQPRHAMDTTHSAGALWALPPPPAPPPLRGAPQVAPAASAAPAPVAAPALPFRLLGRYAEGGREGVVLQGPEGEVFIAHAGETLAGNYRVESLSGNLMVLHYLPLDLRQIMDIGVAR